MSVVLSGTGLYVPSQSISNEELVASYNQYASLENQKHREDIVSGLREPLQVSSVEFIEKASGIKSRYVVDKLGVLDPHVMHPLIADRPDDIWSLQCEMGVLAAKQALAQAHVSAAEVDAVIVSCSNLQRAYPAIAIEIQKALEIEGYAFDMNVACSSATFGIHTAMGSIESGQAKTILMINPEVCSGHLQWKDRDCHFIFGDVCTAVVIQARSECKPAAKAFEIVSTKLKTDFSSNIRNNFGFLNRCDPETVHSRDKTFRQQGRKVFKEIVPMVVELLGQQLQDNGLTAQQVKRYWLHQANINMNQLIMRKLLGKSATQEEACVILDEFANTSSAGSIIAFHRFREDFGVNDVGVLCSFGAGYSLGSLLLRCVS